MTKEVKITLKDVWTAVQSLTKITTSLVNTTESLAETVGFIKDNAVTQEEFGGLREEVSGLKADLSGLKKGHGGLREEVRIIRSRMVTKDYLDRKIRDLRADMNSMDKKPKMIADILQKKNIVTEPQMRELSCIKPFAWAKES